MRRSQHFPKSSITKHTTTFTVCCKYTNISSYNVYQDCLSHSLFRQLTYSDFSVRRRDTGRLKDDDVQVVLGEVGLKAEEIAERCHKKWHEG